MNIWVIFGSRSAEHDVSITSAYAVMSGLKKHTSHKVFPIYITREWKWIYDEKFKDINTFTTYDEENYKDTKFSIDFSLSKKLSFTQSRSGMFTKKESAELDFVFPILHGLNGEDWAIQGIFDMLQVPYMWPSIEANATGMNKVTMKHIFTSLDIPLVQYLTYDKNTLDIQEIISKLSFPLMVKPANLWSSIGISRVESEEDLENALEIAFHYDSFVMVEKCIPNLIELNCSVTEIDWEVVSSLVEQPIWSNEFLSFEEKYVSADGGTMQWLKNRVKIPALIPDELTKRIQDYTKVIYKNLFCKWGAPRIDFLYNSVSWELFVNEINTIPWALQMHLWDKSWYSVWVFLENLMRTWVQKSLERKVNIDFNSNIIGHTIAFTK